jgi:hypothetical protein
MQQVPSPLSLVNTEVLRLTGHGKRPDFPDIGACRGTWHGLAPRKLDKQGLRG